MKRGEIWTTAGGSGYTGKPRPVLIIQSDNFRELQSITVCPITTDPTPAPLIRIGVAPSESNGLQQASKVMIDKIVTVPKSALGRRIGTAGDDVMRDVLVAIVVFLGLIPPRRELRA